jgi:hypothetical protein
MKNLTICIITLISLQASAQSSHYKEKNVKCSISGTFQSISSPNVKTLKHVAQFKLSGTVDDGTPKPCIDVDFKEGPVRISNTEWDETTIYTCFPIIKKNKANTTARFKHFENLISLTDLEVNWKRTEYFPAVNPDYRYYKNYNGEYTGVNFQEISKAELSFLLHRLGLRTKLIPTEGIPSFNTSNSAAFTINFENDSDKGIAHLNIYCDSF